MECHLDDTSFRGINMPTTPVPVFSARYGVQYTGTNSAELAELIDDFTVNDEDASTLTFTSGVTQRTVARNGWLTYAQGTVDNVYANRDDFEDAWASVEFAAHTHQIVLSTGPAVMDDDYSA